MIEDSGRSKGQIPLGGGCDNEGARCRRESDTSCVVEWSSIIRQRAGNEKTVTTMLIMRL